jgi:hypothetical protein
METKCSQLKCHDPPVFQTSGRNSGTNRKVEITILPIQQQSITFKKRIHRVTQKMVWNFRNKRLLTSMAKHLRNHHNNELLYIIITSKKVTLA